MTSMTVNQMRRKARAQGLAITTRNGGFMVIDPQSNTVLAGGHPNAYSMTHDDAARYLTEEAS